MNIDDTPLVAKIPADVDRPDKIIYGLTARQLAVVVVTGLVASWAYLLAAPRLPLPAVVALVLPVVAAGAVLAVAHRDGLSLDRYLLGGLAHARSRKKQVAAAEGVQAPPAWCRVRGRLPAPLHLPVRSVRDDGVLELADGGTAVIVRAGTVAFGLRTPAEQAGLVAAFGRWLNSLEAPVQILMHTRPTDLSGLADQITAAARDLPDPALERAVLDHAGFLDELGAGGDLLSRQILIVLRDQPTDQHPAARLPWPRRGRSTRVRTASAAVVVRRAEETVRSLSLLGITTDILRRHDALTLLAESLSPGEDRLPGLALPNDPITAAPHNLEASR